MTKPTVTFDFAEAGSRSNHLVSVCNNGSERVEVKGIRIKTNAKIDTAWGSIGERWATKETTQDESFYTYTLKLDPPLSIESDKSAQLQYSIGDALGPIGKVPMPPQTVEVTYDGTTWVPLSVRDENPPTPKPTRPIKIYHTNWGQYGKQRSIENENWEVIDHLVYAFIGFNEAGNVFTLDSWGDQLELPNLAIHKRKNPGLMTTLSFGGWTNAGKRMDTVFSAMAADPVARRKFVTGAVAAVQQAQADGIDIDWEYPESAADAANFVLLLQELCAELNEKMGSGKHLTIAAPADSERIKRFTKDQWAAITAVIDEVGVMTYDYFGGFSDTCDFLAPWEFDSQSPHISTKFCIADTLKTYAEMGVPPKKIQLGMPNYARAVIVAQPGARAGLYQPVVGTPAGDFDDSGMFTWSSISDFLAKRPSPLDRLGVKEWAFYNSDHPYCQKAGMCLLSGALPDGRWVVLSFFDQQAAKVCAQKFKGMSEYGGIMTWCNDSEPLKAEDTLSKAIADGFRSKLAFEEKTSFEATEMSKPFFEKATIKPKLSTPESKFSPTEESKKTIIQKTFYAQRVIGQIAKLRQTFGARFGANKKAKILEEMRDQTCHELGNKRVNEKKWKTLFKHRSLVKRFITFLTGTRLVKSPRSYRLLKALQNTRKIFEEGLFLPDRIISSNPLSRDIIIDNSYAKMMAMTTTASASSAMPSPTAPPPLAPIPSGTPIPSEAPIHFRSPLSSSISTDGSGVVLEPNSEGPSKTSAMAPA